ncbi:MAG: ATP-grasp domain-containing protein [Acidimicrobiia bacterium]
MRRIAFVLGKPPRAPSMLAEVAGRLRRQGFDVVVHLPHESTEPVPSWLFEVDLVVQRGLDHHALAALQGLEEGGVRCCNLVAATMTSQDRLAVWRRLAASNLPVPATIPAGTWTEVLAAAEGRGIVVKAQDARRGRGAGVVVSPDGVLPAAAPFEGPYVVQDVVPGDGWDRKLYVAGRHVRGLLKHGLPPPAAVREVRSLRPTRSLTDLGVRVGLALGLEIYGVDVVGSAHPYIIDINPFPGFRGIPDAPRLITGYLSGIALGRGSTSRNDDKRPP